PVSPNWETASNGNKTSAACGDHSRRPSRIVTQPLREIVRRFLPRHRAHRLAAGDIRRQKIATVHSTCVNEMTPCIKDCHADNPRVLTSVSESGVDHRLRGFEVKFWHRILFVVILGPLKAIVERLTKAS